MYCNVLQTARVHWRVPVLFSKAMARFNILLHFLKIGTPILPCISDDLFRFCVFDQRQKDRLQYLLLNRLVTNSCWQINVMFSLYGARGA